jgi:site-specific DNA-methyltransferase (adenine-specific)
MTPKGQAKTRRRRVATAALNPQGNARPAPLSTFWPEEVRSRELAFREACEALHSQSLYASGAALVTEGDSLSQLRLLPSHSVSLILTDPPYHATKKANIRGDTAFAADDEYLEWMAQYFLEWRRVLKLNGSVFCFCDSSMAARLDVLMSRHFNMLSHVVWTKPNDPGFDGWKGKMKKETLRQWYPHSERILFAEPALDGSIFRTTFATLLREARTRCGLTMKEVTGAIGAHGAVNHGGAVSNWEDGRNTPSREQYEGMVRVFLGTGKISAMPPYEDAIRVFNMDSTKEFTDVWTFPSVRPYRGKHPAEKPIDLLQHAIQATTRPGDIVLDCFAGSGNTAIAALQLGRRAIAIEIESKWASGITSRVVAEMPSIPLAAFEKPRHATTAPKKRAQRLLFS